MTVMMSSSTSWASCWAAVCNQGVEQCPWRFPRSRGRVTWTVLNLWRLSVTGIVVTVESELAV